MAAVEDIWLAFAIELRIGRDNVVAQCDYFPPDLVRAAGILGIGIELSTYACCENPGPQPRDGFTGSAGNEN